MPRQILRKTTPDAPRDRKSDRASNKIEVHFLSNGVVKIKNPFRNSLIWNNSSNSSSLAIDLAHLIKSEDEKFMEVKVYDGIHVFNLRFLWI